MAQQMRPGGPYSWPTSPSPSTHFSQIHPKQPIKVRRSLTQRQAIGRQPPAAAQRRRRLRPIPILQSPDLHYFGILPSVVFLSIDGIPSHIVDPHFACVFS
ncbi:hypothetical protein Dimus_000290 [Dionaea muscipula]